MHNRKGLLKFKIELTSNGKRLTANHGLRYIPKTSVLKGSKNQKNTRDSGFTRHTSAQLARGPKTLGNHLKTGDGAVVRALASHQCGPGSIPRLSVICGLSLLVLYSAPRGFSPGTPVFPSPQKPTIDFICFNLLISIYSVPD